MTNRKNIDCVLLNTRQSGRAARVVWNIRMLSDLVLKCTHLIVGICAPVIRTALHTGEGNQIVRNTGFSPVCRWVRMRSPGRSKGGIGEAKCKCWKDWRLGQEQDDKEPASSLMYGARISAPWGRAALALQPRTLSFVSLNTLLENE